MHKGEILHYLQTGNGNFKLKGGTWSQLQAQETFPGGNKEGHLVPAATGDQLITLADSPSNPGLASQCLTPDDCGSLPYETASRINMTQ